MDWQIFPDQGGDTRTILLSARTRCCDLNELWNFPLILDLWSSDGLGETTSAARPFRDGESEEWILLDSVRKAQYVHL